MRMAEGGTRWEEGSGAQRIGPSCILAQMRVNEKWPTPIQAHLHLGPHSTLSLTPTPTRIKSCHSSHAHSAQLYHYSGHHPAQPRPSRHGLDHPLCRNSSSASSKSYSAVSTHLRANPHQAQPRPRRSSPRIWPCIPICARRLRHNSRAVPTQTRARSEGQRESRLRMVSLHQLDNSLRSFP